MGERLRIAGARERYHCLLSSLGELVRLRGVQCCGPHLAYSGNVVDIALCDDATASTLLLQRPSNDQNLWMALGLVM